VIVWLWSAGNARGVTDNHEKAREAAVLFMRGAGTDTAVVEQAHYVTGIDTLVTGYQKADAPHWVARRHPSGRITWKRARLQLNWQRHN
jgi:hypothetical protein